VDVTEIDGATAPCPASETVFGVVIVILARVAMVLVMLH
jgi:hypothetical protein